jgi:hypothetical protein
MQQAYQSFQMTGRQQLLYGSLAAKNSGIAQLYECALRVLSDSTIPGRVFLAAHSIRELTSDLLKILDLPVLAELGRMGDQVSALQNAWESCLKSSCHCEGNWNGTIDGPLQRLLEKLQKFMRWHQENRPKRRDVVTNLFRRADPAGLPLPRNLEKPRTDYWLELHDYFVRTAHRRETTIEEFEKRVDELERFLLETLCRKPSEDFSAIDAILDEEKSHD